MNEADYQRLLRYFDYDFASKTYKELHRAKDAVSTALASRKGDIELMAAKKNIEHDIPQVQEIVERLGDEICKDLEIKFGWKFKFLNLDKKEKDKPGLQLVQ